MTNKMNTEIKMEKKLTSYENKLIVGLYVVGALFTIALGLQIVCFALSIAKDGL